jgi:hypothetical protein
MFSGAATCRQVSMSGHAEFFITWGFIPSNPQASLPRLTLALKILEIDLIAHITHELGNAGVVDFAPTDGRKDFMRTKFSACQVIASSDLPSSSPRE